MLNVVHAWVIRQLTLGEFSSRRAVVWRAVGMAAKIAVFAYLVNIVGHLFLVAFGLLPYPLGQALMVATLLTPPVSFFVALIAYSVVGLAVYDLGMSRQRFEMLSRTDMLSGLMNRRAFLEAFDGARGPVALVLFDIDRFKSINDTLGHKAGDDVIVKVAQGLLQVAGVRAVVARIGGEEFAVLLSGNRTASCVAVADQIRRSIAESAFWAAGYEVSVTVSCGVSEGLAEAGFSELFSGADRALYCAKTGGRNRVVHARELADGPLDASHRVENRLELRLARSSAL